MNDSMSPDDAVYSSVSGGVLPQIIPAQGGRELRGKPFKVTHHVLKEFDPQYGYGSEILEKHLNEMRQTHMLYAMLPFNDCNRSQVMCVWYKIPDGEDVFTPIGFGLV